MRYQPAILADVPPSARFLVAAFRPQGAQGDAKAALKRLAAFEVPKGTVIGLGQPFVLAVGGDVDGLRAFPALSGPAVSYPSTQGSLWISIAGEDPGQTLVEARKLFQALGPEFTIEEDVLSFKYAEGRDLSGYEDGTENPKGDQAVEAAFAPDGSSFVAVQRWIHDLSRFERMTPKERDFVIGRNRETNEELADAPASAHVKRSAQESFTPAAFMLRRSMPWGSVHEHGLYFVAYGASFDAFEAVLRRMAGVEDGVADALAKFTHPVSGGYYWCPPVKDGRLDLTRVLK